MIYFYCKMTDEFDEEFESLRLAWDDLLKTITMVVARMETNNRMTDSSLRQHARLTKSLAAFAQSRKENVPTFKDVRLTGRLPLAEKTKPTILSAEPDDNTQQQDPNPLTSRLIILEEPDDVNYLTAGGNMQLEQHQKLHPL
jgi:polyisoprenoid-binding protein YceI